MALEIRSIFDVLCEKIRETELTFLPNLVLKIVGLSPELRRQKCGRIFTAAMFLLCVVYEMFQIYIRLRKNSFESLYLVRH